MESTVEKLVEIENEQTNIDTNLASTNKITNYDEDTCSNSIDIHKKEENNQFDTTCNKDQLTSQPITESDGNQYEKLLELNDVDLICNTYKFECITCFEDIDVGKGVILQDCLHEFCKDCLTGLIKASDQAIITCPFRNKDYECEGTLQHREIKLLVDSKVFERYLYRSLQHAQKDMKNYFQCKTPDCRGVWEYEDNVTSLECPLCQQVNCHKCSSVHDTLISCQAYQKIISYDEGNAEIATKLMYEDMFANGKALHCPKCQIVITRSGGCSWVVCHVCKTEICWATLGPRWGPKGNGDTNGGCRCDFNNNNLCHPNCSNCH